MRKMDIIYHLVPVAYYEALDPQVDYVPSVYERDGFIHCTDTPGEMARVANRYYVTNPEPHYYLYIDRTKVRAPVRYDDAARLYSHIYGALNRDAICAVRPARRGADGTFLPPEELTN